MDSILEVRHLKIAFRTNAGVLKAVRDISFDLKRGRTLAIVGESGSGKSVTCRAIMGILSGNSVVEGGEIFYDGKDLLHIGEEEMQKIRGDKISMIFQDPLSSLNPIVRIGPQIMEAMLLKNKTSRREAGRDYHRMLDALKENMKNSSSAQDREKIDRMTEEFSRSINEGARLERDFNASMERVQAAASLIGDLKYQAEKVSMDLKPALRKITGQIGKITDRFVLSGVKEELFRCREQLDQAAGSGGRLAAGKGVTLPGHVLSLLDETGRLLQSILDRPRPDFLSLGYYTLRHPHARPETQGFEKMNRQTEKALDTGFMQEFFQLMDRAVSWSAGQVAEHRKSILPRLREAAETYRSDFSRREGMRLCKALGKEILPCIDRLEVTRDPAACAFESSLAGAIDRYFGVMAANPAEEKSFARRSARRERLIARGKEVTRKVVPKNVYDPDELRQDIVSVCERLADRFQKGIGQAGRPDARARSMEIVDYLKKKSSRMEARITRTMARERALHLMEEVGIRNPRERFNQYPFELSGGMCQRIVIAIALAADPDILICDEPTTALDVTIQTQILELINRLKRERSLSIIFITHDLGVVANMADDLAVMYAGKIVEYGTVEEVFYAPAHPYTWALLASMPDPETGEKPESIPGMPPDMISPPRGDAFADRNPYAMQIDFRLQPPAFPVSDTHWAATWLLHPNAPRVESPRAVTERIAGMKARLEGSAHV